MTGKRPAAPNVTDMCACRSSNSIAEARLAGRAGIAPRIRAALHRPGYRRAVDRRPPRHVRDQPGPSGGAGPPPRGPVLRRRAGMSGATGPPRQLLASLRPAGDPARPSAAAGGIPGPAGCGCWDPWTAAAFRCWARRARLGWGGLGLALAVAVAGAILYVRHHKRACPAPGSAGPAGRGRDDGCAGPRTSMCLWRKRGTSPVIGYLFGQPPGAAGGQARIRGSSCRPGSGARSCRR